MTHNKVHIPIHPPKVDSSGVKKKAPETKKNAGDLNFAGVLEQTRTPKGLNLSAHAKQRLQSREINLEPEEMKKLEEAVDKAAAKGCRSSLLLYRDMAFVAGVQNRTIVTAMDGQSMKEHVFTNIDSAVVVE